MTRLLKESPGKRDARNFLKQFDASKPKKGDTNAAVKAKQAASEVVHNEWGTTRTGVNLGNLYQPTVFTREPLPEQKYDEEGRDEPLHLALVKLRLPQTLSDETLRGIALTLSQMTRLGLSTAVVLDCYDQTASPRGPEQYEETLRAQAARFCAVLGEYNEPGALIIHHALEYIAPAARQSTFAGNGLEERSSRRLPPVAETGSSVNVVNDFLLYPLLDDGVIPIILPFTFSDDLEKVLVDADEVILALTREFSRDTVHTDRGSTKTGSSIIGDTLAAVDQPSLDRIIILDPLGGIPSRNRTDGAHVFVNLEAEYRDIDDELRQLESDIQPKGAFSRGERHQKMYSSSSDSRVDLSHGPSDSSEIQPDPGSTFARHRLNLDTMRSTLELLPPTSSGLILTPFEAATKAIPDDTRTTPSKNPLLHNLLTDRPMISSSLPTSPNPQRPSSIALNPASATFLKKGVPLTMIPDPRGDHGPWHVPTSIHLSIDLATHPSINLPKLVSLINDSFQRTLDAPAYLERIRGRVAGVIIAGDYEGAAICTWETPSWLLPFVPYHEGLITSRDEDDPHYPMWIPYLDKFAVLTSSQGSGGIADIVWAALTRTCFPHGVVWRSRTSNPVNKWYQERAEGTWNLPGGEWTMFWTTGNVTKRWGDEHVTHMIPEIEAEARRAMGLGTGDEASGKSRWDAYVDVCSKIKPNWADGIERVD